MCDFLMYCGNMDALIRKGVCRTLCYNNLHYRQQKCIIPKVCMYAGVFVCVSNTLLSRIMALSLIVAPPPFQSLAISNNYIKVGNYLFGAIFVNIFYSDNS